MQWGAFIGGMAQGGLAQYRANLENERQQAADTRAQEDHDARMQEVKQNQDERTQLKVAAAPITVQQGANGYTKPASADDSDVGQSDGPTMANGGLILGSTVQGKAYTDPAAAQAAADAANTPDAIAARQASVYRSVGKPVEAAQLDSATTQGKLAKVNLDEKTTDIINKQFDRKLAGITTPEQLAGVMSGSPMVGGATVGVTYTPDGKQAQLTVQKPDGSLVNYGDAFDPSQKGLTTLLAKYSQSMGMGEKVTALQHIEDHEEQQRQFNQNLTLQQQHLAESVRHDKVDEGTAAAHLGIARESLGLQRDKMNQDLKNDPYYKVPGGVKLRMQGLQKGIDAIDAAVTKASLEPGGADPKGLQDLQARRANLQGMLDKISAPYLPPTVGAQPSYADLMGKGGAAPAAPGAATPGSIGAAPPGGVVNVGGRWMPAMPMSSAAAGGLPQATSPTAPTAAPGAAPSMASQGTGADPLMAALGGNTGDAALNRVVAAKAPALRDAASTLKAAQADVVAAAKSGDQGAVQRTTQAAQAANEQIEATLKDMDPRQAQAVRAALGI